MTVEETIKRLEEERKKIWLTAPEEVTALGRGEVPRGTGARGQYLSTIIFAEGEARTFADEFLWSVIRVIEDDKDADLKTLQAFIDQMISYKADFFDFVGLPGACAITKLYVAAAKACKTKAELLALTNAALSWANRMHMWVDFILPWGIGDGFRRKPAKKA